MTPTGASLMVGGLGGLTPADGADLWLRAVAALATRHPGLRFRWLLTGDGPMGAAVEHELWHLGIGDVVTHAVVGGPDALGEHLANHAALMLTGRPGCPPAVRLDAIATSATPVAAFAGGPYEPVARTLVEYPDVVALAQATVALSGLASGARAGVSARGGDRSPSGRGRRARSSSRR